MTEDGVHEWEPVAALALKSERILAGAIGNDSRGVAVTNGGLLVTKEHPDQWVRLDQGVRFVAAGIASTGEGVAVAAFGQLAFPTRIADYGDVFGRIDVDRIVRSEELADGPVAAIGPDGFGMITSRFGSMLLNGGDGRWQYGDRARIRPVFALAFSEQYGSLVDREGRTIRTINGGQDWGQSVIPLKDREEVSIAVAGAGGHKGLIGGDMGSAFLTADRGGNWTRSGDLMLQADERLTAAALGGMEGLVAGDKGSVSITSDGGTTWHSLELGLQETEWITGAVLSADGHQGIIAGDQGSVFVRADSASGWRKVDGDTLLEKTERIRELRAEGSRVLVVGTEGSVFMSRDGGASWRQKHQLKRVGFARVLAWDEAGDLGLIVGESLVVTSNAGETWTAPLRMDLKEGDEISVAAFGRGGYALAGSSMGDLFGSLDGGRTWDRASDLSFKASERIVDGGFLGDGKNGWVVGDKGSVFVTRDGGKQWLSTNWEHAVDGRIEVVANSGDGSTYLASHGGSVFMLGYYPTMGKWMDFPLEQIRQEMGRAPVVVRNSDIAEGIRTFIGVVAATGSEGEGDRVTRDMAGTGIVALLNDLTVRRTVMLIIVFFLVRLLVQLYHYDMRLSAFWDSRADAMVVAQSYAMSGTASFDELVGVLGPDAYDFKAAPKPMAGEVRLPRGP